jgi:hypothetical protein
MHFAACSVVMGAAFRARKPDVQGDEHGLLSSAK